MTHGGRGRANLTGSIRKQNSVEFRFNLAQNADLDPKIRECRLNPTPRIRSETLCATKKSHEKLSKGRGKVVRSLRIDRWCVLFGIADREFERYLLIIITQRITTKN